MPSLISSLSIAVAFISLTVFLTGLTLASLQLTTSSFPSLLAIGAGLAGLILSSATYFLAEQLHSFLHTCFHSHSGSKRAAEIPIRHSPTSGSSSAAGTIRLGKKRGPSGEIRPLMNADSTETLMRSIRGIPYLIQAIQYSLETSLMNEMGQGAVIHTAPGCTSILDCDSCRHSQCGGGADRDLEAGGGGPPGPGSVIGGVEEGSGRAGGSQQRCSGPEEQWEPVVPCGGSSNRLGWTNQQLRLAMMNRRASSSAHLAVFPYSESRPLTKDPTTAAAGGGPQVSVERGSTQVLAAAMEECGEGLVRCDSGEVVYTHHGGSMTRITLAAPGPGGRDSPQQQRQIRCIGMSSAFLSRFNNSFRM